MVDTAGRDIFKFSPALAPSCKYKSPSRVLSGSAEDLAIPGPIRPIMPTIIHIIPATRLDSEGGAL